MHSFKLLFGKQQDGHPQEMTASQKPEVDGTPKPQMAVLSDEEMHRISGGKSRSYPSMHIWNISLGGQMPQ